LGYLATNLNGTSETFVFHYDADGDGFNNDTILFQDGAADTVVQLVGIYNGVEAVTGGTAGIIEIA